MKFFIATTGKTHSGKTTFGKSLSKQIKNSCLLDNDILTDFLKKSYPKLYNNDLTDGGIPSEDYDLKHNITTALLNSAYKKDVNIIYTAASSTKEIRKNLREQAHKNNKKLILIYFNISNDILLERINKTQRKKNNKNHIKEFTDLLLNKQNLRYEYATSEEADIFFEVNNEKDIKKIEKEIIKLVK